MSSIETSPLPIPPPPSRAPVRGRSWLVAGLAGLIATAMTFGAGEVAGGLIPQKVVDPMKESADLVGFNRVVVKNAAIATGLQGALLGLSLGLAGAVAASGPKARTSLRAATGGGLGFLLGGGLGAAGAFGLFSAYYASTDANSQDMIPALLTHTGVASLVGAAAGLAFGVGGRSRVVRGLLGGGLGAGLGAASYQMVGALVFPSDGTADPIATAWLPRLIAHALVDVVAALGTAALIELAIPVAKVEASTARRDPTV